jgi:hypothetical protein
MPGKIRRDGPPNTTASPDRSLSERVRSFRVMPVSEQGSVAERKRHDRRFEFLLVPILMQVHPGRPS